MRFFLREFVYSAFECYFYLSFCIISMLMIDVFHEYYILNGMERDAERENRTKRQMQETMGTLNEIADSIK